MSRAVRNLSALLLTAAYLAAVSFGHLFHNHGLCNSDCVGCAPSASSPCHDTDRDREPDQGRNHACNHGCLANGPGTDASPCVTLSACSQGSHFCPICHFYSHHGTLPVFGQLPTSSPVCEPTMPAGFRLATRAVAGPQQPRAPPPHA